MFTSPSLPASQSALATLDREYLVVRAKLLEVAAALDRIDRADGSVAEDPRRSQLQRAIEILASPSSQRAPEVQLNFSLPYDASWRQAWAL